MSTKIQDKRKQEEEEEENMITCKVEINIPIPDGEPNFLNDQAGLNSIKDQIEGKEWKTEGKMLIYFPKMQTLLKNIYGNERESESSTGANPTGAKPTGAKPNYTETKFCFMILTNDQPLLIYSFPQEIKNWTITSKKDSISQTFEVLLRSIEDRSKSQTFFKVTLIDPDDEVTQIMSKFFTTNHVSIQHQDKN